jgi:hypothetical protein
LVVLSVAVVGLTMVVFSVSIVFSVVFSVIVVGWVKVVGETVTETMVVAEV